MCAWYQMGQGPNQQSLDKARGETRDETHHTNEMTGQPCTYCTIPATDAEKAYYQCPSVPKPERERRLVARDYTRGTK